MAEDDVAAGGFAGHEAILHRLMEGADWSRQVAHAWFCDAVRDGRLTIEGAPDARPRYDPYDWQPRESIGMPALIQKDGSAWQPPAMPKPPPGKQHFTQERFSLADLERELEKLSAPKTTGTATLKPEPKKKADPIFAYALGRLAARLATDGRPSKQSEVEEALSKLIEKKGYEASERTVRDYVVELLRGYDEEMGMSSKTALNCQNRPT